MDAAPPVMEGLALADVRMVVAQRCVVVHSLARLLTTDVVEAIAVRKGIALMCRVL